MRKWLLAAVMPLVCLAALGASPAAAQVPIVFEIPSGADPTQIWVQFLEDDNLAGTYNDVNGNSQTLAPYTAYSLASITSPVSVGGGAPANKPAVMITSYISGRVYVNYGAAGLSSLASGYTPDATGGPPPPNHDPNAGVRYQYFEPTIVGTNINVDLSYIDFTAIPMSMEAVNSPNATNNPQLTAGRGVSMVLATAATALPPQANVLPSSAQVLPTPGFARVLSPGLGGAFYHDWTNYLQTTLPGQTVSLKGCFVGVGNQPTGVPLTQAQSYDFTVTFDSGGNATLTANSDSGNGQDACVATALQGPGVGNANQTVTINFSDLNAVTGVYGNNPPYTINNNGAITTTTGIVNDFFGRVVGDLLAGLSFGYPASVTPYTSAITGQATTLGAISSTEWWGGMMPGGTFITLANSPAGQGIAFNQAQPGQPQNYHTYAASLVNLTSGYGFALQDRLGNNLMVFDTSVDANAYLRITINPDSVGLNGVYMLLDQQQ